MIPTQNALEFFNSGSTVSISIPDIQASIQKSTAQNEIVSNTAQNETVIPQNAVNIPQINETVALNLTQVDLDSSPSLQRILCSICM
jgi:hypothetical protein